MISSYERSEAYLKNFEAYKDTVRDHELEFIADFKQRRVLPLVARMANCNLDLYYKLKDEAKDKESYESASHGIQIKASITKQKVDYQRLIDDLKELGLNFHTGLEMQDKIFEVCQIMLDSAIKYDFPEQAIETIKLMQDARIVGEKNCHFVAIEALKGISRSYIKRYLHESSAGVERVDLKTSIRDLINRALTGEFGDVKEMTEENLEPKEFASIFKGIFTEAVQKHEKVSGKKKA